MSRMADALSGARYWASRGRRFGRRLRATIVRPQATLVYHRDYRAVGDYLVDPERAQKIIAHLLREGHINARHIVRPGSVTIPDLASVHELDYLISLDDDAVLHRIFGTHTGRVDTDAIIAHQRRMVAGTALAARLALDPDFAGRPVVNLGGGLHHAHHDQGGGFCIFNDVAVAIAKLRDDRYRGRILVVDLDLHHGDGTRRIFADDDSVFTFSMHATSWDDKPATAAFDVELGAAVGDHTYLESLSRHLPTAFALARPDLVFYVAGVDIAFDDRLGSWRVSADAILERDRTVLALCGDRPMVWVLAGGYGTDAWRHTARSLSWILGEDDRPVASRGERNLHHFRRIATQFEPGELTREDSSIELDLTDLIHDLGHSTGPTKLLNYYSRYGVEAGLERYGVLPRLRELGYGETRLEFELDHATGQMVRLYSDDGRRDLLVELVLKDVFAVSPFRLLSIEWLLLQNPRAKPTPERPLLPGQEHPGLGGLRLMVGMLVMACERLSYDGLHFAPAHYHTAAVARGILSFVDPHVEAHFLAVDDALADQPLGQASAMIESGRVVDATTGEPVHWKSASMVIPVSEAFKALIEGPEFEQAVRDAARELEYRLVAPE